MQVNVEVEDGKTEVSDESSSEFIVTIETIIEEKSELEEVSNSTNSTNSTEESV